MADLNQLQEIQDIDLKIDELSELLNQVRIELKEDGEITSISASLIEISSKISIINVQENDANDAAIATELKLKSLRDKLYGGEITNSKELEALEDEGKFLEEQLSTEEDLALELMESLEILTTTMDRTAVQLEDLKQKRGIRLKELEMEEKNLSSQIKEFVSKRSSIASLVTIGTMNLYETLRQSRGGIGIAEVDRARGICQACRITIPVNDLQKVRSSGGIVQCNSCRRILYV